MIRGFDFSPVDPKTIPRFGRQNRYLATINEFLRSGAQAVEIDNTHNPHSNSVTANLRKVIRKHELGQQVAAVNRDRRVYLVRVRP